MAGTTLCTTWLSGWLNGVMQRANDSGSLVVNIFLAFPCGEISQRKICPSSFKLSIPANSKTSCARPTS